MSETDLSEFTYDEGYIPFSHIIGSQLSPGESHAFPIKVTGEPRDIAPLVIHISYKSNAKLYEETISLNFASDFDKLHLRANTRDQHLKEISFALQDIAEKML